MMNLGPIRERSSKDFLRDHDMLKCSFSAVSKPHIPITSYLGLPSNNFCHDSNAQFGMVMREISAGYPGHWPDASQRA